MFRVGKHKPNPESSSHSTKGIYGLKKYHDAPDAVADIVFLHGLTGNRETTWTNKSTGVFWPAHLLKIDVPNTRIVTFGYDADIAHFWGTACQNCIRNHAVNLANALAQLRERTKTEGRPIVFVAHSLGGLVFEDAMLASRNSPEPHLQRIYNSTVGICFLGTPHCGSALANWATLFGQIARTVKSINTELLRALEPKSSVLALIQGDFHAMLRGRVAEGRPPLFVTCFYEELPVPGVGEIVPKHSAILPAYNSIGIHANHMDMAKFTNAEDPGYLSVSSELLRWVRAVQKTQETTPPVVQPAVPAPSSPRTDNPTATQNPSPSPWADNPLATQKPSSSPWTQQPTWSNTPRALPSRHFPPQNQPQSQYPAALSAPGHHAYCQTAPSPLHPALPAPSPAAPSPQEQPQTRRPPTPSRRSQDSHGRNVISGTVTNYGNGKIVQGETFYGSVTF